jgi:hypothetical protein
MKFKTKEEAIKSKNKGDRLFYDHFMDEYFIISPRKYVWKEGDFEENFIVMPKTFEECVKLRSGNCEDCAYLSNRIGSRKYCRRRALLLNRSSMEVFE